MYMYALICRYVYEFCTHVLPGICAWAYYIANIVYTCTYEIIFTLYRYLKTLIPLFNECADSLMGKLQEKADGEQQVPMKQIFSEITLDVIGKVNLLFKCCRYWQCQTLSLNCYSGCTWSWSKSHGFWSYRITVKWPQWGYESSKKHPGGYWILILLHIVSG